MIVTLVILGFVVLLILGLIRLAAYLTREDPDEDPDD